MIETDNKTEQKKLSNDFGVKTNRHVPTRAMTLKGKKLKLPAPINQGIPMELIFIALLLLIALTIPIAANLKLKTAKQTINYIPKESLLTQAEQKFFAALQKALSDSVLIFSHVRVIDVIEADKKTDFKTKTALNNKINRKHFDFVLCDKTTTKILCAIELNDKSHNRKDRTNRDNFLAEACQSANVPLLFIPTQANYSILKISEALQPYMPPHKTLPVE